jgi:hypothetical protein
MKYSFRSLFPGASFYRMLFVLGILEIIIQVFGITETPLPEAVICTNAVRPEFPLSIEVATSKHTHQLFFCLKSNLQSLRDTALRILLQFPSPLPGLEDSAAKECFLERAFELINSLRGAESDSGALHCRLLFSKALDDDLSWLVAKRPTLKQYLDCPKGMVCTLDLKLVLI